MTFNRGGDTVELTRGSHLGLRLELLDSGSRLALKGGGLWRLWRLWRVWRLWRLWLKGSHLGRRT